MSRRLCVLALIVLAAAGARTSIARADGDPGSDVLVSQNLFVAADAGLSVKQQVQLGNVLQTAGRSGFPVRVAIIAHRDDLGAVTALWGQPRAYARFLGQELSLAYQQRLLVVMPSGFGFNWPGHSAGPAFRTLAKLAIRPGGSGLLSASQAAVQRLAAASGVKLGKPTTATNGSAAAAATAPAAATPASGAAPVPGNSSGLTSSARSGQDADVIASIAVAALVLLALAARLGLLWRRRRQALPGPPSVARHRRLPQGVRWVMPSFGLLLVVAAGAPILASSLLGASEPSQSADLESNPYLDPGTPMSGVAPNFTLSDQFGKTVSLRSFRGKVVILDFNDSECTTICPLTTTAMLDAKAMLGAAGSHVQLLGVDANPRATAIEDVLSYSQVHGMVHQWQFLTGSLAALKRIWKAYGIAAEIQRGQIAHTPALFVIDSEGRLRKLYITQQSYAAVGQLGQVLARESSRLLPGHPQVHSNLSYAQISGLSPHVGVDLPRASGGTVHLGPGESPHLLLFFATWDQEVTSIGGQLDALDRYASAASAARLPALTAIDEGSVEPSSSALPQFLRNVARPLDYPVAIDQTGRVADGYEVQGEPWFVLTSATGQILWYWQVSTSGWLSDKALTEHVRAALAKAPQAPAGAAAVKADLAGSPAPLASLHAQASQLLGSEPMLAARIRALRGYRIVVNAWASWCTPCRAEFGLFAEASAQYGRRVAFLGADTGDSAGDARSFLSQHPVSYPSYQTSTTQIQSVLPGGLEGLPTTIFINRAGKVVYVHTGQYDSQGTLDADVASYG
jgi:cytochrome oxidase Cu insertion factor (SCO1/SenC/PrrC family)/thiol-disulfide isomerase/thioredoxin